ncbi:MAG: 3-oxoadipyl-CoA thiolase [Acidiferrobacterales bacterium]|nr:3-oxoadipyl-CoA thiolase [Acidiferrobacterales bacterium]
MTQNAFICDYVRTPIGRFAGALSSVRVDDLAAQTIRALAHRHSAVDWDNLDEVILGCANQAGEDNRNLARMSLLLAGLSETIPGVTINRLCASGMDAIQSAARAVRLCEADLVIAGGAESMSRAPLVMPKSESAFSRNAEIFDTTIGWRFVNPMMREQYGVDSMPETAENVATEYSVSREDQDLFAWRSQQKTRVALDQSKFSNEIIELEVISKRKISNKVHLDEHPRPDTTLEQLSNLTTPFKENGTVTAGNASGVNDGAAAVLIASESACDQFGLQPVARVMGAASYGVAPRVMGIGPVPATQTLCDRLGLEISDFDVVEINEAFASQSLACMRQLGFSDDAEHVNIDGGAIALGHPLGMSGARITGTAARLLNEIGGRYALATMCVGVGQGMAIALERV